MTKEGLEFIGVSTINQFDRIQNDFLTMPLELKIGLQTCHSISMAGGKTVGNFVDVEMFKATNASLDYDQPSLVIPFSLGNTLKILKRYEYVHCNAYMSVVCQDTITLKTYVFLKGSSERIANLADVPADFLDAAAKHSRNGCYVVAIAYKEIIGFNEQISRSELESGCRVIGLILFRNELKKDSKNAVYISFIF